MAVGKGPRMLSPTVLETKEELRTALKSGQLRTSKYNALDPQGQQFVELLCFGGYTGEQAIRALVPNAKNPAAIANKFLSDPAIAEAIEELTVARDKKFGAEVSSARDLALEKLKYIMMTSDDQSLQVACAKIILDKAGDSVRQATPKDDDQVGHVTFNIRVANNYVPEAQSQREEPVILELTPEEIDPSIRDVREEKERLQHEVSEIRAHNPQVGDPDPDTGLPYTLVYEGIDNYRDAPDDEEAGDSGD